MQDALIILIVGMFTVFTILALVVGSGRLLISLVNRWEPQLESRPISSAQKNQEESKKVAIDIVVLTAAVEAATGGRGRIQKIEKL